MENPANKALRAALFVMCGIVIGAIPGAIKLDQMRREVAATTESTGKQIEELKRTALGWQQMRDECNQILLGDGTKTVLYGPNVYDVWMINRRVTPLKPGGPALGGSYVYMHPDGTVEGPFQPRGVTPETTANR